MEEFSKILSKAELAITMTCIVGFTSVLILGAAVRLLGHLLNWCNDVALLMLAWATFLGGDVAFRISRMVNMDILVAKLPVRFQKVVAVMIYAVLLVIISVMVKQDTLLYMSMGRRTLEDIPFLSYAWVAASIPVGFSLIFITAVKRLYDLMMSSNTTVISKV